MRHVRLKLTGLMLALALLLTGCNLIGVDAMKQLDVDFAKLAKDYEAVVAEYDGGTVTKGDVIGNFASTYSYYAQMYNAFGMTIDDSTIETIKQQSVESAVQSVAIEKQIESRGLSLPEEKLAEIQTSADENYKQAYDSFYASAEGKDEAVRARQTEYNMYAYGYSKDTFYKLQLQQANYELVEENVKAEVEMPDEAKLTEKFNEKVAEDEENYSEDRGAFETAMSSEDDIVTWMPEGYRTVKHILVKPADDVLTAVTDARTAVDEAKSSLETLEQELDDLNDADAPEAEAAEEEAGEEADEPSEAEEDEAADEEETDAAPRTAAEIEADIEAARTALETAEAEAKSAEEACLASVKDKTDEIYAKLSAGEDFASLIAEYGEDPGMQNEPTATRGYYVCADSANWDANFTAGAMALESIGDYSQTPVISTSGVHIIRYETDVTPGAVALDSVREKLSAQVYEDEQNEHFESELTAWTEALKPVYHLDAFTIG